VSVKPLNVKTRFDARVVDDRVGVLGGGGCGPAPGTGRVEHDDRALSFPESQKTMVCGLDERHAVAPWMSWISPSSFPSFSSTTMTRILPRYEHAVARRVRDDVVQRPSPPRANVR